MCEGGGEFSEESFEKNWFGDDDRKPSKAYSEYLEKLYSLLADKGFCDERKVSNVPDRAERWAETLNAISPGPRNAFGFMNEWQRMSYAYRYDGRHGFSGILLVGLELPITGGWLVTKFDFWLDDWRRTVPHDLGWGISGVYSPSASRFVDWYVAAGAEKIADASNLPDGRDWAPALELGMRFRFALL